MIYIPQLRNTILLTSLLLVSPASVSFELLETSIEKVHLALRSGTLSCETLTRRYVQRIQTYDQASSLNSIIIINPEALLRARELDRAQKASSTLKPLHCFPLIVKDNYATEGLQTTAGSTALLGFIPDRDAWQITQLKQAGALILAKSNMAEWAFSPAVTISSVAGETRNPYNLNHVPAGSSGGTAAAIAANFGLIGLGTDTGNSIRGPASHTALVGIRPTMGLSSRSGIVPLYLRNDVAGPLARSVSDATRVLEVIIGSDPTDASTSVIRDSLPVDMVALLRKGSLKGVRIGVLRQLSQRDNDPRVIEVFEQALSDLAQLGAELVDPFSIDQPGLIGANYWCKVFKRDLNEFLSGFGPRVPVHNLNQVLQSGRYADYIEEDLRAFNAIIDPVALDPPCETVFTDPRNIAFRNAIVTAMNAADVSAVVYPTWNFLPARVGHPEEYLGDNSQLIAPHTGLPAITVPMGYVDDLPTGLQFLGRLFSEHQLLPLAYDYEQATHHRKPPAAFDTLPR